MKIPGDRIAWFRAVAGIVRRPQLTLQVIRERRPWFGVVLVLSVATVLQAVVAAPFTLEATSDALGEGGVASSETVRLLLYVGLTLLPVLALFGWLLDGLLIWLLAAAFGGDARFGQAFSLTVHLAIVNFLGGVASFVVVSLGRGFEWGDPGDPGVALGVNLLMTTDNGALVALYSRMNPFALWFAVLLMLGSITVFGLDRWRSCAVATIHWAVTTTLLVATSRLAEIAVR